MKCKLIAGFIAVAMLPGLAAMAETLHIATKSSSMLLDATPGNALKIKYYGARLADSDAARPNAVATLNHDAYPAYGVMPQREAALAVRHADGRMDTRLTVREVRRAAEPDGSELTTVTLTDSLYPIVVDVNYRTRPQADVIETWTEITNNEKGPVELQRFASGYLPVRRSDVWTSQLFGTWADEAQLEEAPLPHNLKVIKNKDGVRNSGTAHSEVMISLDGKPREESGRVIGAALCYTGNYKLMFDSDESDYHHFFAGINEEQSGYTLRKGERFVTPVLALTYSSQGLGQASRNFHDWGRRYRLANGDRPRDILLNSWEGVYFGINEEGMGRMMDDIASMGGELFVMDDGWFGVKYPRNNDVRGLGDWSVDTRKLPAGIKGLCRMARDKGVKFGIWIEPEMVNTLSELYDAHPDWVIGSPGRKPVTGRGGTQLVLDMGRPEVQDLVFNVVDTLLTNYPEIAYIKWDANAPVMEHGSHRLAPDRQSHLFIDYHRGLEKTLRRIRDKYPDVTIQACASGGSRVNWGILPWFDEVWTSDNTDALQRIKIQWGTSYFFPAIVMGSHISARINHQTGRPIPLKFRTDVAMSGRLGMEIQPADMTDAEKEQTRRAIADYKKVRNTVQFGDLYRLLSPFDNRGAASLMYVAPEKDEAVFFWWKMQQYVGQQLPRVVMQGLDPGAVYTVAELNRVHPSPLPFEGESFTGAYLMSNGLEMPLDMGYGSKEQADYASRVLHLVKK